MLIFYRILSYCALPFIPLVLQWRAWRGKEERTRLGERQGCATIPRPEGKLVWFHAASMGESGSVLPLIARLAERYPELHILLTTVTVTSARNVTTRLPERAFHQFVPVDTPVAVQRFLQHWQPDMAVWVESEFWPNLVSMTKETGCPMVLLNARISKQSARMWYRLRSLAQGMLEAFDMILAKSDEDASRLKNLGAQSVEVRGNLKFASPPLEADPKITAEILAKIGDRPAWLASSTHAGEEAIVATVHKELKETFSSLLTVIVPRHSRRGTEIVELLRKMDLRVARRSTGDEITNETDIYLADTMGELGIFYRLAGIVFVGGSLVAHGGQNPLEPARLDCAILYGPHMDNFHEFCHELEAAQGALKVHSEQELTTRVSDLLRDNEYQERLAKAALKAAEDNQQVLEKVEEVLVPYFDALLPPSTPETEPSAANDTVVSAASAE